MTGLLILALLGTSLLFAFIGSRLITWTVAMAAVLFLFAVGTNVSMAQERRHHRWCNQ